MQPPYIPVIVQYGHTQAVVLPAFGIVRTVCISFFAHEHSLGNRPLRSAGVISFLILRFFVLSFRYRPFFRHIVPRRPGLSGRDAQTAGMPDPICARYPGCTLCHKRRLWIVRCCLSALSPLVYSLSLCEASEYKPYPCHLWQWCYWAYLSNSRRHSLPRSVLSHLYGEIRLLSGSILLPRDRMLRSLTWNWHRTPSRRWIGVRSYP